MKAYFVLAALLVFGALGAGAVWQSRTAPAAQLLSNDEYQFIPIACWFDADWTADITCGELHTPTSTGKFRLPVVILKEESAARRADPVVYLQGGPGAGARLHSEGIKRWLSWMRYAQLERDLILIDTRGTGRSRPALVCADFNRTNQQLLREHISLSEELERGFTVTGKCFEQAVERDPALDYRHFSTQRSAQDVRALMRALNYPEWNILGVSYGTRLALEIAHQEAAAQTSQLKAMVLDSVYPAGFGGVQTWPQVLDDALQQFFRGCAQQQDCRRLVGSIPEAIQARFMQTLQGLRESPREMTIKHWDGEAPIQILLNDHRFLSAAFAATYNPQDWQALAQAMIAVEENRRDALKPLLEPFVNQNMSADFNSLTFTAVDCADNPVLSEQDYLSSVAQYPLLQEYTRDQWRYQQCHQLVAEQPLELHQPQVPSLILAGELDPVTPADWARVVHGQWQNSQLHISKQVAHSVLTSEACLLQSLREFYDQPQQPFEACN